MFKGFTVHLVYLVYLVFLTKKTKETKETKNYSLLNFGDRFSRKAAIPS